ncbi:MAG: insulinase family protein, partial [Alphaproteobacteria bacterium]|nr:insulinase family protein [Alphaproteobacteria bacterium]
EAAIFNHLTGQPSWLRTTLRQMDSVVPRDVRRFAGEWLTPERRVTALLLPPGHPGLPDSVEAEEQDRADKAADAESSKPERGEEVDPLGEGGPHHRLDLADLAELPQGAADLASLAVDPDLSALRRFTLDSGLEVVLLPYGDVPTVEARLVLRGGEASEPAVGLHYATLAFTSFGDTGVPERSGEGARLLTYDEAALAVGGTLRMLMEDEALVFRMSAAAGNTDDQLYLLARLVSEAELLLFDMDAMDLAVEDLLKDVPPAADAYTWRMSRTMPGHPLAESAGAAGLRGSARRGSKEIKDWFRATYQPSNATLILVGDLDPEAVQAQVEQRFGVWPAPRKPTPPPADTPAAAPALPAAVAVFPGENPDLAELVASCRVAPETSPEALAVAARLLDAEVFDALRARSGLSYTPFADAVSAPGTSGMLVTWATVDAQRVDEALSTLDAVLAKLAAAPPEPALLDAALRAEANERVLQHLTTWQLSDLLLDTIHSGQEPEALLGTGARLAEVRAEHVQAAFQACQATRATSIVGPPEAVAGLASP